MSNKNTAHINSVINIDGNTGLANKTGTWRNMKPIYLDRIPPCNLTCPSGENIQLWLSQAQEGDFKAAWETITNDNPFPAVMGRVCYHTCEKACNRNHFDSTVSINILEKFIGDNALENKYKFHIDAQSTGKTIAIIGAGPAGLSAAYFLAKSGHSVTIFEEKKLPGGMLRYGVPSYRLSRDTLDAEIQRILDLGVKLHVNTRIESIDELANKFDAVLISSGAHIAFKIDLPAKNANIYDAVDFLRTLEDIRSITSHEQLINAEYLKNLGTNCIVYGGGNTAIDVARALVRLNKNVKLLYRRERETMSAHDIEINEAIIDGVQICPLHMIHEIDGKNVKIEHMQIQDNQLKSTGNFEILNADSVFFAVGQTCDQQFFKNSNIQLDQYLQVVINDQMQVQFENTNNTTDSKSTCEPTATQTTSPNSYTQTKTTTQNSCLDSQNNKTEIIKQIKNVFAAGDIIPSQRNVTVAIGHGKKISKCINAFFNQKQYTAEKKHEVATIKCINLDYYQKTTKKETQYEKNLTFNEVGLKLQENVHAVFEAKRCFSCGNCFECDNCYAFCPDNAIKKLGKGKRFEFNYEYCKGCGICATECPCGAIKMIHE